MSQLTDIGKFRKTLEDMIAHVKTWLTRDQLIAVDKFEFKLNAGMKIDPRGSINLFVTSVNEYAYHIMSDNDKFFLETNFTIDSEFIELRSQMLTWWPEFKDDQKEFIRKRIKLLIMLGAICTKNEELRGIINQFRDADNPLTF
jgi:hypothetical protein